MRGVVGVLLVALGLGACAPGWYCQGELEYQKAGSVPPLKMTPDLKLPESSSALNIPPAPKQSTPYGESYQDADGKERIRCLDMPPTLPEPQSKIP
ncbi:MAG: hypothetical protein L0Y32_05895 [Nevskiales bacterium]|nr:hypothetical protein [Nevskiales bacterium]